jgi:hypothetical protein
MFIKFSKEILSLNYEINKYYSYLILFLYLILGIYISYYFPIADDAGKYFAVLKEIANGSDIDKDIHGGTVRTWYYIFGKAAFHLYNWSFIEYRILLFVLNVIALGIFINASHNFLSVFTVNIFVTLYLLTFFNLAIFLDASYYPITSFFMILGSSFAMFTLKDKNILYYLLSLFCFLIITMLRPNLLPMLIIIFYIGFVKTNIKKFYILVASSFLISTVVIIDLSFFNGNTSNINRTEAREKIINFISSINKSDKQLIVENIFKDAEKDLLDPKSFNFVGDDPSTFEKNIEHYYCQQQLNPRYNFKPYHCFFKSRNSLSKEVFLKTNEIIPYLISVGKWDKANVTNNIEESYFNLYRYNTIKDHLKNILKIDFLWISIDILIKFLFGHVSLTISLITVFSLYYCCLLLKDKYKLLNDETVLFFYPFIGISILSLLRYLSNQDFSYFFHSLFFMTIVSSIGLENFVTKYFDFGLKKIKLILTYCILGVVTLVQLYYMPTIKMNNPYLLVSQIKNDKTYNLRETNVSPINLELIGSYVNTITNENYITDFVGLGHFTKSNPLIGTEMNQNVRFYDSLNLYKCPFCYNEPLNFKVTNILAIEYLISYNKIPVIVNFGEIDHSFFRRHITKLCLARVIGSTEIWKTRFKKNKSKINPKVQKYNLKC